MRLPALWIAASFAAGIVATRWPGALILWFAAAAIAMLLGGVLLWRSKMRVAWALALIAWAALGGAAIGIERSAVPADHVTRLIGAGRLDTTVPLRWRGRLREDPMALPWGRRYEIDLERVEVAGASMPVSRGLRLNLYGAEHFEGAPRGLRAGDRVEALVRARPPRNFLDPGAFDERGYLARQKIDLTGSLRSGELLRLVDRPSPTPAQRLAHVRGTLLARLDALFPYAPQRAAVLRAMLLGDRSFVDSQIVTAFQKTAAYHVLVVAGLHVGALVVFFLWACRRLRFTVFATSVLTVAALAAYVGVVQDRPPIFRAALMAAFYLCARPLFRRIELLNTVALAALAILFFKPSSLADSSFELSFVAAGVIAGLAVPWMERTSAPYDHGLRHLGDVTRDAQHPPRVAQFRIDLRAATARLASHLPQWLAPRAGRLVTMPVRVGLRLWEIVLLSAVIQWGMMPLLARDFHRVSLAGPLSNIPAVILTGLIVPLGFLALLATFAWARLASVLAKALGFCTGMLLATVEWFSRLPHVSYRIPGPPVWLWLAFFAAFIALAVGARAAAARRSNRIARRQLAPPIAPIEWASAIALAALTVLVAAHPFRANLDRSRLEVTVLDVGQGDSIFAAFPGGRTMLIDGGGLSGSEWVGGYRSGTDIGEEVVSPYLWSRGLKRLDVVVLTHADHDHLDGLYSVLENFPVRELWIGSDDQKPEFQRLLAEAHSRGIAVVHRARGDEFDWHGAEGDVLWPPADAPVEKSANNDSLVLRLSDGRDHFLLTGDIEKQAEQELVARQSEAPLTADFLKVPHHGSKTSSTEAFLDAVAPRFAVASVGESNAFGHPAAEIVERYERDGAHLFRTDRDGAITAVTDGQNLSVHTYAARGAGVAEDFETPVHSNSWQSLPASGDSETR
ncbi:MAG TPA: DNA internalization-related competence protein ComEC/Rec2 [Candidatus Acidoferrales bacterium]|jgi:competence protein ComEC|nr:DNA internalization-related competence protein ComEC/Rec2 [Candidatus Acidoferrales bacterium]